MTGPLDMSKDPDRFVPEPEPVGAVSWEQDPDRFDPAQERHRPGRGQTLPELLGESGAHEDDRDNLEWLYGLLGVLAFLALVTLAVNYL